MSENFRDVVVVLMCGGRGARFWPLSTPAKPKQFLTELTGRSLYELAVERARTLVPAERVLVLTNQAYLDLVREQSPEVPEANIVLEPQRRDTAPACVLAAALVERRWPGSIMIVMPADHLICDLEGFRRTMTAAVERARQGGLGTVGIRPTCPATEFGYLQLTEQPQPAVAMPVERFVEKPERSRAEEYVASGRYLWNSGLFVWQSSALLAAATRHLPQVHGPLAGLGALWGSAGFADALAKALEAIQPVSIDFGVMEKEQDVWTVPGTFPWSDVGGWRAACDLVPADSQGNQIRGPVLLENVTGSMVITEPGHPVIVVGVDDCVVVHGQDGTLVCRKEMVARLKFLVERIG